MIVFFQVSYMLITKSKKSYKIIGNIIFVYVIKRDINNNLKESIAHSTEVMSILTKFLYHKVVVARHHP